MRLITSILPTLSRFPIPTVTSIVIPPLIPSRPILKPRPALKPTPTWILKLLLLPDHQRMRHTPISFIMNEGAIFSLNTSLMAVEVFAWDGFVLVGFHLRVGLEGLVEMGTELVAWGWAHALDGLVGLGLGAGWGLGDDGDVGWGRGDADGLVFELFVQQFLIGHPILQLP